jgi:hypothetical protein
MYQFIKGYVVHKWLVMWYIMGFCLRLLWRGLRHDLSKISKAERSSFIALASSNALRKVAYKSEEYKATIEKHRPIIDIHYKNNPHHPDHYGNGILDMNLFDIIEMVCDWRAAGRRTKGGNLKESFKVNRNRYDIPQDMFNVIRRTFISEPYGDEADARQVKKTWIIVQPPGLSPIIKRPMGGDDGVYKMLKELELINPDATLIVCQLAYGDQLWVESGRAEIAMHEATVASVEHIPPGVQNVPHAGSMTEIWPSSLKKWMPECNFYKPYEVKESDEKDQAEES